MENKTGKLKIIFSFVLIHIVVSAFAQFAKVDYKNGYIINNNNDTIMGSIAIKEPSSFSRKVIFIDSAQTKNKYNAADIIGFSPDSNRFYLSQKTINPLIVHPKFMKALVKGYFDLYSLQTGVSGICYYIKDEKNILHYLKPPRDTIIGEVSKRLSEYTTTLKLLMNNDPPFLLYIDSISYNDKKLTDFIKKYNEYKQPDGENVVFKYKSPKIIGNTVELSGLLVRNNYNFGFHYFRSYYFPEVSKKLSYNIGFSFLQSAYEGNDVDFGLSIYTNVLSIAEKVFKLPFLYFDNQNHRWKGNLFARYIGIPVFIKYEYTLRKIQPYIYAGTSLNYLQSTYTVSDGYAGKAPYEKVRNQPMVINHFGVSFYYGSGIKYWISSHITLNLYLKYEYYFNYGLGFGYAFKDKK